MDGLGIQVTLGQPDVSRAPHGRALPDAGLARARLRARSRPQPRAGARGVARRWSPRARGGRVRPPHVPAARGALAARPGSAPAALLARLLRHHDAGGGDRRRRRRRPRRPAAGAAQPAGHAADLPRQPRDRLRACAPEAGPLQFYNWIEYINQAVVNDFEKKYGVKVQISTFTTIDEAVAKLASGAVQFDVFVPETVFLEQLVVGKILQPLNHSYIPNLARQRLAVARRPLVRRRQPLLGPLHGLHDRDRLAHGLPARLRPGASSRNPWSALVDGGAEASPARSALLDDEHDGLDDGPAPQRRHSTPTPRARRSSSARTRRADRPRQVDQPASSTPTSTSTSPTARCGCTRPGRATWPPSPLYTPKGTPASVLRYWWPTDGRGPINNDMFGVLRGARNPVLAHLFLDHLLDVDDGVHRTSPTTTTSSR